LKAPIKRVSIPPVPIPYSEPMEQFATPLPGRIVATARELVGKR
jgi:pyruvate/2-oxoglutarate/acetoin dehydrogenase E1 component